jgi:hypothetical protein
MYACAAILLLGYYWWQISLLEYIPTQIDIRNILRISALEGRESWTNGFFGPGYTAIYKIIDDDIGIFQKFAYIQISMLALSTLSWIPYLTRASSALNKLLLILLILSFYFWLTTELKTNYTDGIFMAVIVVGLNGFIICLQKTDRWSPLIILSLLMLGSTALFRHQGLVFSLVLLFNLKLINIIPTRTALRFIVGLMLPLFLLLLLIFSFDMVITSWQKFNLYKFFYGVSWHKIDVLIRSDTYLSFNPVSFIFTDFGKVLETIFRTIFKFKIKILTVVIIPILLYISRRDKFYLVASMTNMIYSVLVLPGILRGIYPAYLLVACSCALYIATDTSKVRKWIFAICCLLMVFLVGAQHSKYQRQMLDELRALSYAQLSLKPAMEKMGIKPNDQILTDDFTLFVPGYNPLTIQPIGGWVANHPKIPPYNMMLKQNSPRELGILYLIIKRGGYIETNYKKLNCSERFSLPHHTLCKTL